MFQGKDGMQGNQCCMAASSGYKASIASATIKALSVRNESLASPSISETATEVGDHGSRRSSRITYVRSKGYMSSTEEKWRISLISLFYRLIEELRLGACQS
jgi:hypothetical protein